MLIIAISTLDSRVLMAIMDRVGSVVVINKSQFLIMISERQKILLATIVKEYIDTFEPISSKSIEKEGFFGLSSASIRSDMNDLETHGYLDHLYTSSGRVPTQKAYRYFVDNVITQDACEVDNPTKRKIDQALKNAPRQPESINKVVARLLSDISDNLVIAGINERQEFYKMGISSLFELPEFQELDRVFQLSSFFDEFEDIFNQIEDAFGNDINASPGEVVRIFIGRENPLKNIKDEAVLFANYNLPGQLTGSLTLVGPMRMDYEKNIGLVRYMKEVLDNMAQET